MSEGSGHFERLIETSRFPVGLVSEKSAWEKAGGGRPPYWGLVFWWTRKPLIGARAIIAGALLPSHVDVDKFCSFLRLKESSPHRRNPVVPEGWSRWLKGKSLLDPFAGFGSIPLEALRLGLSEVVSVELLPSCYIFLQAILEYPLKYGIQLAEDVKRWSNWIAEQIKEEQVIQRLYEPGVSVYIGSWEIRCPHCGKWTILLGNWWLARLGEKSGERKTYTQIVWMKPKINDDRIEVEIVDLNKLSKGTKFDGVEVDTKRGIVTLPNGKVYEIPKSKIDSRRQAAVCLHCNNTIRFIHPGSGKHYAETSKCPGKIKRELIWYVKYAMKKYHEGDASLAKPTLLVKIRLIDQGLKFEPCTEENQKKLEVANQEVAKLLQQKDVDVPTELIPAYENRRWMTPIYGADRFHTLFNSRQLLTLVKLTKLIRVAGELIEQEKLKDGLRQEEARKYAEGVTTFLAIALCKFSQYSSLGTYWNSAYWGGLKVIPVMAFRGIALQWNWCESDPLNPDSPLSFGGIVSNYICNSLNYLLDAFYGNAGSLSSHIVDDSEKLELEAKILLDDATVLGELDRSQKFNLIVTDPPYYDDVPYAELSDFYYVWLKRALSDSKGGKLIPKFLPEAFFKRVGAKSVEIETQWMEFAKREVSLNPGRFEDEENRTDVAMNHFLRLLTRSFIVMRELLKEDGLLITYYAHTSPNAWIALLEACWVGGRFRATNAFSIATESLQRVTARGKYALDTSIVVVWRKGCSGSSSAEELYDKALREARFAALELIKAGRMGSDLFVGTMASILSLFTRYENLYSPMGVLDVESLVTDYVYPATAKVLAMALGEFAGTPGEVKRPESLFYLITKALFPKPQRAKRKLDRSNTALLSIGTKAELDILQDLIVLRKEKENFYLEEPATADRNSFEELLQRKGINPVKPTINSPVDALHLLEYHALTFPLSPFLNRFSQLKEEYSSEVEEAINIAAILAKTLPATDPEKGACQEIIARIKGEKLA